MGTVCFHHSQLYVLVRQWRFTLFKLYVSSFHNSNFTVVDGPGRL